MNISFLIKLEEIFHIFFLLFWFILFFLRCFCREFVVPAGNKIHVQFFVVFVLKLVIDVIF